jgi:membrane-bound serine protease (ClpP class)
MDKKGRMSTRRAWLLLLASLIDDAAVLAIIFVVLFLFNVEITWWLIFIVLALVVIYMVIMHKVVIPAIRRRAVSGAEGMIGMTGRVTESLKPKGTVKIKDEFWRAKAVEDEIEVGEDVEVVGINGLDLKVKRKKKHEL